MKNMWLRAHFSDNSCKKISSLILKCIKGTTRTFPRVDLYIPLMHCDPSDLGSMILFLDHSKKCTLFQCCASILDFDTHEANRLLCGYSGHFEFYCSGSWNWIPRVANIDKSAPWTSHNILNNRNQNGRWIFNVVYKGVDNTILNIIRPSKLLGEPQNGMIKLISFLGCLWLKLHV